MEVDEVVSQLGSLQTNDQEELVNQMMRLVGANINFSSARFYLEMNQWNVQAAVCSYFDLETGNSKLPGMVFLQDITIGEGDSIPPNTKFVKTWRVQNPGPDRWPPGCILRFSTGIQLAFQDRVLVEPLDPYTAADISVEMTSPANPGMYESKWRMSTATGNFFGEIIWVIISVEVAGTLAITQQFSKLDQLGSRSANLNQNSEYNPFRSPNKLKFEPPEQME
eukprot:GFUD01026830.1.p1 GENE.GFUD01026830.1~~GFUD01026830.1.p1  ORF type:complete len:223 (-),score=64.09 GFUD01026830.1:82-750(-)